jgi:phage/plasmid-like protein (TIGR03299 family)
MRDYSPHVVSTAYAANGTGPAVYGRYRDRGYAVNPLTARVGTLVPENFSASDAFAIAGLDWTAQKQPVYYLGADGPIVSPEHCAIVRSDNSSCLGIHGSGYTPVQNTALVNLLDYLREDIRLESVLSIHNGRRVFATATIDTENEVVPGDKVRRYLHLFNSHDGSTGFGVFFSDVRLACANQLNYLTGRAASTAAANGDGLRRKHTSSVTAFASSLPHLIDLERRSFASSIDELRSLTSIKLTTEIARRVLEATFADKLATPIRDKTTDTKRPRTLADLPEILTIREHYAGNTGLGINTIPGIPGTAYALFNAITQHETTTPAAPKTKPTAPAPAWSPSGEAPAPSASPEPAPPPWRWCEPPPRKTPELPRPGVGAFIHPVVTNRAPVACHAPSTAAPYAGLKRPRSMQIPDTPEELFERLSDSSVREIFANYDELKPRHRKLVHIFHTELTKGGLTDAAFLDSLAFITVLWRCFNATARHNIEATITESADIDTAWINAAVDYGKVEQFIHSILNLYDATPDLTELEDNTTYQLRPLT